MAQIANGPDLTEIFTINIGFKSVAGEVKVQLPVQWPSDAPPPTSSSLLSIASAKGLLAAAGPSALVLLSTDRIRAAYKAAKSKDEIIKLQPDLTIPGPRLSHVTFTSDNTCLVVAAESGGGLAAHAVEALKANHKEPIFELSTEGIAVKALVPNPAPELAQFVAVLLANGHLMLANFQERSFVRSANGASIKDNVTSVAWSVRGKQLVVGLSDGTAVQLDAQGNVKAAIPRPSAIDSGLRLSTIVWLANDEFLTVHSLSSPPSDSPPDAVFHWLRTDKERTKFEFKKIANEPCFALQNRTPASYFVSRLRKWSTLEDVVILSSSASSDVALLTNAKVSLSAQADLSGTTDAYTITALDNDTRKAALPMSKAGSMDDTYPIGQAIDLSSKDKVWQPIPGDDSVSDETPHPLPALTILNNEGMLLSWWFVNDEALRKPAGQEIPYPGLVNLDATTQAAQSIGSASMTTPSPSSQPAFVSAFSAGKPAFGTPSFSKPAQPGFGTPSFGTPAQATSGRPAFGQSSFGKPAFGSSSVFGAASPWGTTAATNTASTPVAAPVPAPAFGKPAFGASGSGFGQTASLGQASPWGTPASSAATGTQKTPFGGSAAATSGFAKFASGQNSAFGSISTPAAGAASPFAANTAKASPFGSMKQESSFGQTPQQSFGSTVTIGSTTGGSTIGNQSLFGSSACGTPANPNGLFGQATAFSTPAPAAKKDEDMSEDSVPQINTPAVNSAFGAKTPFSISSSFKPATSAKERDEDAEPQTKSTDTGFGLGSLGSNLGSVVPEVKPDPSLPTKSLFDIPTRPPVDIVAPTTNKVTQPVPPDVVSKPAPSSSSGTFSADSSAIVKSTEVDELPSSPPASEDEGVEVDADSTPKPATDEEDGNWIDESADESLEHISGDNSNDAPGDPTNTPARLQGQAPTLDRPLKSPLHPQSIKASPFSNTPVAPKAVMNLKGQPFGRSPLSETSEVPPPVPTPPISGPIRLFPSMASSTTPSGIPSAPLFAAPKPQGSPRSPSPVRHSAQAVSHAPQVTVAAHPPVTANVGHSSTPSVADSLSRNHVLSDLYDVKAEAIRIDLSTSLEPTTELPSFVAHTDYAGRLDLDEIAGNIERVYRDINSMIDTLGQNVRALRAFVSGHQVETDVGPEGTDISDASITWTFDDIDRLRSLEHNLERNLLQESVTNTNELRTDIAIVARKLRPAKEEQKKIKQFLSLYKDPAAQTKRRHAPLDPEAASRQRDLLTRLASFKKALAEAEDKATMVKAKLASRGPSKQVPTVEAVEKTILKMTAMVQRRSMEVDYLESQMRKFGITAQNGKAALMRESPAKSRGLDSSVTGQLGADRDAEYEWRVQRAVAVRAKRRAFLNKVRDEVDKVQPTTA